MKTKLIISSILLSSSLLLSACKDTDNKTPIPVEVTISDLNTTIDENPDNQLNLGAVTASSNVGDLEFTLSNQQPSGALMINSASGELFVEDSSLFDYEVNTQISATVTAATDGVSESANIFIDLVDIPENVTTELFAVTVNENVQQNTNLGVISASTDGDVDIVYSLVDGLNSTAFDINSSTGEIFVKDPSDFDYETNTRLVALFAASNGVVSERDSIIVDIVNVVETIVANSFLATVNENPLNNQSIGFLNASTEPGLDLSFSLINGEDASAFYLDPSTGELKVQDAAQFDFETSTVLTATYQVDAGALSKTNSITINIGNITESLTANPFLTNIQENLPNGTDIGGVFIETDGDQIIYELNQTGDYLAFNLDDNGRLTIKNKSLLNYEAKTQLTTSYTVNSGNLSEINSITVNLIDVPETVSTSTFQTTIDENPAQGFVLGTLAATSDGGASITYSLLQSQNYTAFNLDQSTGQLSVADVSQFDFELNQTLTAIYVADNGVASGQNSIIINLNDLSEAPIGSIPFVTKWETTASNETITIPVNPNISTMDYNFSVDWGDGTSDSNLAGSATHTFVTPGLHTISITGDFPAIYINFSADKNKLKSIDQWGNIAWRSMDFAFTGCQLLEYNASDAPDLSQVTSMKSMFYNAYLFDGDLSNWDVSNVRDMDFMFAAARAFNGNIDNWDVSNVTNMRGMFTFTNTFNRDLSNWNVANVESMRFMFESALLFNQNIGGWNIQSVNDMTNMLKNCGLSTSNYDGILNGWAASTNTPSNVPLGADNVGYSNNGTPGRSTLINDFNWTITGDILSGR